MFEVFSVPCLYLCLDGVLSLFSSGRTSGIVLDSGEGVTNIVPIFEAYAIPHAIERIELAGQDLTQRMHKLMTDRGYNFSSSELNIINGIKERTCSIAEDFNGLMADY